MTTYLISYDLIKRKDYPKLWEELERLGAHRTLESLWLLSVNNTAKEVSEHFEKFIDNDDKLWVSELTKNRYYKNAKGGTNDWLKDNPSSR
ncbi:CRISPR-associated protein Cas2 [Agrobacterium tumefaciens]|uniref:CRISPR-associated protein Cas2 n=1 Tax=Agrobacterium tumefaciens TaxID=358 RepID=UPI000DD6A73C|nr:CRISPR-associated protein Cas2 [Agrobacterium tumefaciens]